MTAHPTPAPASVLPHRTTALVITAVVALLVGVALGGLSFWIATDDGGGSRAEQDMAAGCLILERVQDELPVEVEQLTAEEPLVSELIGAGNLFMAAATADESYESVFALGDDLRAGVSYDLEVANSAITQLQTECATR